MVAQLDALSKRFASAPLPASRDSEIARLLRERALAAQQPQARRRGWRGLSLARRAAVLAVAALTVIAVLTGATLAFAGPIFPWNYGFLQQFGQGPQGETVNLAGSACGYTLKVRQVYADANVFIVGYALYKPDGQYVGAGMLAPVVTDANGATLPVLDIAGSVNLGGSIGTVEYQTFDTGAIQGQPASLKLHLVVPGLSFDHGTPAPSPCVSPASAAELGYGAQASATTASAAPTPAIVPPGDGEPAVQGPFVFDVTVMYHLGRQSRGPITDTQHGRTLTLERVVSTPLETRFYVSGAGWNSYATLHVGFRTIDNASWGPEGNLMVYRLDGSPYSYHGQWTFTIHTMSAAPSPQDKQALPPGTWSFTFTLP